MNPTPKTLIFNDNQSTLKFIGKGDEDDNVYNQLIIHHTNANLQEYSHQNNNSELTETLTKMITSYASSFSETHKQPSSMSVAVIRYKPPNDNFPLHIDHTNNNSYVYLLNLGCSANFIVKGPVNNEKKKEFKFQSGDVLVFDPSSNAGILHGVSSINVNDFPTMDDGEECCIPKDFQRFRFGVQCRVKWNI